MTSRAELEKLLDEIIASDSYESARKAKQLRENWRASLAIRHAERRQQEPEQEQRKTSA